MNRKRISRFIVGLFLTSVACGAFSPKSIPPGSFEEKIAEGNVKLTGTGNITYIGCQDPTAAVTVVIGPKTKELDGIPFDVYINSVTVSAITNGTQVKTDECQKVGEDDQYNWPAKGIYYAQEGRILFTTCTQNEEIAEGAAYLVGEGFEGEYACYDRDGGLMYVVAISAYEMSK